MSQFYGREGSFQDFYLELPTKQVVDRDLGEAKLQVEVMKENALAKKEYDQAYLKGLQTKYKLQKDNLDANFKLTQANYDNIFEAHQANAQREFENMQKMQGNPAPNSALESLIEFAPKLAQLFGEYQQKQKEWNIKTTTDFIVNTNLRNSDVKAWRDNKELILSNSLEAQLYIKAESERLGVQLTPQKMLSVLNVQGELAIIQQEALNHNAVRDYGMYLSTNANQKIVLNDGTETTWGELQVPTTSGDNYSEGLRFMRSQFLAENDINILEVTAGPLGDLGQKMIKVEDTHLGTWSRSKSQDVAIQQQNAITTQWTNSVADGGQATMANLSRRALLLGSKEKPDFERAWGELFDNIENGLKNKTYKPDDIYDIMVASDRNAGPKYDRLRGLWEKSKAIVSEEVFQNERNRKAASLELKNQYIEVFTTDWNGVLRTDIAQLRARMQGQGMTNEDIKEALSVFTTPVNEETNLGSNSKDPDAKGLYDNTLQTVVDTIGQQIVGGDNASLIDHSKIIGWGNVEGDITAMYREYYNREWKATIGSTREKAEAAARYARDEVIGHYRDNLGLTAISADKELNSKGEEVVVPDEKRTYKKYDFGSKKEKPSYSKNLARLKDTAGVSPTDRVLSMSKPEDGILDKSDVDRYVDSGGNISLKDFRANPLVREIVRHTGIPASDLYQRHAELYGLPTLSDTDHFSYEELQQSTKEIQRMVEAGSTYADQIAIETRQPAGSMQTAWYFNPPPNGELVDTTSPNTPGEVPGKIGKSSQGGQGGPVEGQLLGKSNYIPQPGRLQGIKGATLNVREEDWYYIANTVMGEAGPDDDMFYVAANIITRMSSGRSAQNVVTPKGQYLGYHPGKTVDPNLIAILRSPEGQAKVAEAIKHLDGRTQFRGVSLKHNMGDGDVTPNDRSNYYFHSQQAGGKGVPYEPWMSNDHAWKHMVKVAVPDVPQRAPSIETKPITPEIRSIINLWGLI